MMNSAVGMKDKTPSIRILTLRDQKVVLDSDLATVYGVRSESRLLLAVKTSSNFAQ
jgi:hypothetical protein